MTRAAQGRVRLEREPQVMHAGGEVTYRVFVADRWVGWIGDGREWRGWRYGGRRWWACWRQDGDTGARWNTELEFGARAAACAALLGADPSADRRPPVWATSCPPPRHNFTDLPLIRSERPAFELHYPHLVERYRREAHVRGRPSPFEVTAKQVGREELPSDGSPVSMTSGQSATRIRRSVQRQPGRLPVVANVHGSDKSRSPRGRHCVQTCRRRGRINRQISQ